MIIELDKKRKKDLKDIEKVVRKAGCRPEIIYGEIYNVIAVEGNTSKLSEDHIAAFPGVVKVWRVSSRYKTINRIAKGQDGSVFEKTRMVLKIKGPDGHTRKIGDGHYIFIAGPCAVESRDQVVRIADQLRKLGDKYNITDRLILRGGAFKPRTRPTDFRGLGMKGVDYLDLVRQKTGMPYVTEVMGVDMVKEVSEHADVLQIGTRNYQNFNLLEEVGKQKKPVLYKRGISAPLEEWLDAAEYIANQGNKKIILCERGVKSTTHGDYNRSHIDFDVIPAIKERTILPVVIDPSHSSGADKLVPFQFRGATVYGANGTITEVMHDAQDRKLLKCDAAQALRVSDYENLVRFQLDYEGSMSDFLN